MAGNRHSNYTLHKEVDDNLTIEELRRLAAIRTRQRITDSGKIDTSKFEDMTREELMQYVR